MHSIKINEKMFRKNRDVESTDVVTWSKRTRQDVGAKEGWRRVKVLFRLPNAGEILGAWV